MQKVIIPTLNPESQESEEKIKPEIVIGGEPGFDGSSEINVGMLMSAGLTTLRMLLIFSPRC